MADNLPFIEGKHYVVSGDCWLWIRAVGSHGYGNVLYAGRYTTAPRVVATITYGMPEPTHCVLHECDTRRCIRPEHLRWGSQKENMADALKRGRPIGAPVGATAGERNGRAKLTSAQVQAFRSLVAAGRTCYSIAKEFDLSPSTVRSAVFIHWAA